MPVGGAIHEEFAFVDEDGGEISEQGEDDFGEKAISKTNDLCEDGVEEGELILVDQPGAKKFKDKSAPAVVDLGFREDEDWECDEEADIGSKVPEESDFDVVAVCEILCE